MEGPAGGRGDVALSVTGRVLVNDVPLEDGLGTTLELSSCAREPAPTGGSVGSDEILNSLARFKPGDDDGGRPVVYK